jgi:SAM domain (Sterile alpha motif)
MDVVVWLRSLGLGKYEAAFRENEIDQNGPPPEPDGSKERATGFRDNNERVVKEIP